LLRSGHGTDAGDEVVGEAAAAPLGVDVSAHALTKYPSGGGDVLMGSVITRDLGLHRRIKDTHMRLGFGVSGNDAELVLRSLSSIHLRYAAADTTTRALAAWALTRPEFAQVMHPSLPSSPGHAHWRALCDPSASGLPGSAACLFSVMVDARFSEAQVDAFCDGLKLFKLGYSWAGPMSLVVPYKLSNMRATWPKSLQRGHLVRFSAGLERAEDLVADLRQAADAAFA
jgi:cysteine-S-conjugate beta-lyase